MSTLLSSTLTDDDLDAAAVIRERERFDWFAGRLERWIGYYTVDQLRDFAQSPPDRPGQRKKALVLLALSDEDEALETLRALDMSGETERMQVLYNVALQRAAERHELAS